MALEIFAIKDVKTGSYGTPFFSTSTADATRSFCRACMEPESTLGLFPQDFELWYMGTFVQTSGEFTALKTPEFVTNGVEQQRLIKKPEVKNGN